LNSIIGYKSNTENKVKGKNFKEDGKAEAKDVLDDLKTPLYNQLKTKAAALGINENDFKNMFNKVFDSTMTEIVNNDKIVDVQDYWINSRDVVKYKVKDLVDGFITKFESNLNSEIVKYQLKH